MSPCEYHALSLSTRTLSATAVALLAAMAVVAGPAAAAVDVLAPGTTDDGGNSSLTTDVRVGSDGGGNWSMTCSGAPAGAQGCDKAGDLEAGPLAVYYEGDNHANVSDQRGGGGDEVTLDAAGRNATIGFECTFEPALPSEDTCPVDANMSDGGSVQAVA